MKLKSTDEVSVYVTDEGKICIYQESKIKVYLTLEQFNSIESWVFKNRDEIELTWNGGVSDEADS